MRGWNVNSKLVFDISAIISTVQEATKGKNEILPVSIFDATDQANGIIFLKPEICNISSENLQLILKHLKILIDEYSVNIKSSYVISGSYLLKNNIIDKNYRRIKKYASLSVDKKRNQDLNIKDISILLEDYEEIVGGIELIKRGYNADYIMNLWLDSKAVKLRDDLFYVPCYVDEKKVLLVNGFFPYQVAQYKEEGSKIIFFTFSTNESFERLKTHFQGSADSTHRYKNSFRQYLFDMKGEYGLGEITPSRNGIHMSANPKEGYREVQIFKKILM